MYTTARLILRAQASTSSKVKTTLPKGLPVYVQKKEVFGEWYYIKAYPQENE